MATTASTATWMNASTPATQYPISSPKVTVEVYRNMTRVVNGLRV